MAAPYNPPVKGEDFVFEIGLASMAAPGRMQVNPTIAAGDFQISKDGGAFANLTTLPTVTPASGRKVVVSLSATEMNADRVFVQWVDQTDPPEWGDGYLYIPTIAS